MELRQYFTVKEEKCLNDLMFIHPILLNVLTDFIIWSHTRNLPVVLTRIIDEKIPGISTSNTHAEGRAIDISIKGWDVDSIDQCRHYFNKKYQDVAAIGEQSKRPILIPYIEHGTASHIHIQIKPIK